MFEALMTATVVAGYIGLLIWLVFKAADSDWPWLWLWGTGAVVMLIFAFALLLKASADEEAKGPCLREETSYILVNNVMTPYTYCAERGAWVK